MIFLFLGSAECPRRKAEFLFERSGEEGYAVITAFFCDFFQGHLFYLEQLPCEFQAAVDDVIHGTCLEMSLEQSGNGTYACSALTA